MSNDDGGVNADPAPGTLSGDPAHELFGSGWTPENGNFGSDVGYTGRHRTPDV